MTDTRNITRDEVVELTRWMADTGHEADDIADAVEKPWKWWPDYAESDEYRETHTPAPEDGDCRYPEVEVQLTGEDGNTGAIMGRIARALKRAGVPEAEVNAMRMEMLSGDYANVLATAERWVTVH